MRTTLMKAQSAGCATAHCILTDDGAHADSGCRGSLVRWRKDTLQMTLEIVESPWAAYKRGYWAPKDAPPLVIPKGFVLLKRRGVEATRCGVVERTFARLGRYRRLSKHYEYLTETSEAMIRVALIRTMLRRLSRRIVRPFSDTF